MLLIKQAICLKPLAIYEFDSDKYLAMVNQQSNDKNTLSIFGPVRAALPPHVADSTST